MQVLSRRSRSRGVAPHGQRLPVGPLDDAVATQLAATPEITVPDIRVGIVAVGRNADGSTTG